MVAESGATHLHGIMVPTISRIAACCLLSVAAGYQQGPAVHRVPHARTASAQLNFLKDASGAAGGTSKRELEAALVQWLETNGVYLSDKAAWGKAAHPLKVESETVEDFELSGRGVLARKDIQQGEQILTVPPQCLMTKAAAVQQLGPRVVTDSMGDYVALAMLLISERAKGASSFWAPYINILPTVEEVGQTWTWNEDDLAMLKGSSVTDSSDSLRRKLQRDLEQLTAETITPNGLDPAVFTWEAWEWAFSMLFSRAINLRETEELAMVPYADLLNHSPYCSSYFFYNSIPFSKEREVALYADRNYAKNDQVLISYGQKSNAELVLLYGFVVDRNLFDEVEISVALDPTDARYDEKAEFLRLQGLQPAMAFPLLIDRYSSELMQFLRLCCVTPAMDELASYKYSERISLQNERSAFTVLRDGCYAALANYPESESDDAKLMENGRMFATLSRNARMAVKLRRNEKRILQRTINTCDQGLEALARVGKMEAGAKL